MRMRILIGEFCGAGKATGLHGRQLPLRAEKVAEKVHGAVCTDSKGTFDAVHNQESAELGMTSVRSAIEAYALKLIFSAGAGILHFLWLAGDWIDTGLPATIESAVRSGHAAARLALGAG